MCGAELLFRFTESNGKYLVEVLPLRHQNSKNGEIFNIYQMTMQKNQLKIKYIILVKRKIQFHKIEYAKRSKLKSRESFFWHKNAY